jgi:hypothetical protein
VERILSDAGFREVRITPHEEAIAFGGSRTLDEAVDYALQIGPTSRFVADTELALDPRVRELVAGSLRPFASEAGVLIPTRAWLVTARRP